LIEAIRYGNRPEVKARLKQRIDHQFRPEHLQAILAERSLAMSDLTSSQVQAIREQMERAEARRLQPHYIQSFFFAAFAALGGRVEEREPGRFEVTYVPLKVRRRETAVSSGRPILARYTRICFDKKLVRLEGKPQAEFVCPGHPLLEAVVDIVLERNTDMLKRGAVLVDPNDPSVEPRVLFLLTHEITDERVTPSGREHVVSRGIQFVERDAAGHVRSAGYAPHLDYEPLAPNERYVAETALTEPWLSEISEKTILPFAVRELAQRHLEEVRLRVEAAVDKMRREVEQRLRSEIRYWERRAVELRELESATSKTFTLNSTKAKERADELARRLDNRRQELERQRRLHSKVPNVIGGALVLPRGYIERALGGADSESRIQIDATARRRIEHLAMQAVMERELAMGHQPTDVSAQNLGYDIESRTPDGRLRFIEVKGRAADARTVTVTRNEILTALNRPDQFILAVVLVDATGARSVYYIQRPFEREIDFAVTSVNLEIDRLIQQTGEIA
jgi:hypothetical protein